MKKYFYRAMLTGMILMIVACKKNEAPTLNDTIADANKSSLTNVNKVPYAPLTVITIAGMSRQQGNVDGQGAKAKFATPGDIKITEDGTIFITDKLNNSIRKISTSNVVSTVTIPNSATGQSLKLPDQIVISPDGTLNILADVAYTDVTTHPFWIVSPNGQVVTPLIKSTSFSYHYLDLQFDPYNKFLKLSGDRRLKEDNTVHQAILEDFEVSRFLMGTNTYTPPVDSLIGDDKMLPAFGVMYCAYNGVKFFVIGNKHIYKLTPSGVFTLIYRDLDLMDVSGLIATRDTRTLYIVNRGKIESIFNGKLTFLAGPNLNNKNAQGDGVGSKADVTAFKLALSKDESTLYFTDQGRSTVRKILLK